MSGVIFLASHSEELEAVAVINVLRRAEVDVTVASITKEKTITCSRQTTIVADTVLDEVKDKSFDVIVLPGGMPGANNLRDSPQLVEMLKKQAASGKWIAAICAAPAVVLGAHGFLKGVDVTGYPAFDEALQTSGANLKSEDVVVSGKFVTSRGPGTAIKFGLKIAEILGKDSSKVAAEMLVSEV